MTQVLSNCLRWPVSFCCSTLLQRRSKVLVMRKMKKKMKTNLKVVVEKLSILQLSVTKTPDAKNYLAQKTLYIKF